MHYKENGRISMQYEIVFPYQLKDYSRYERVIPPYNIYGSCSNSSKVDAIFESDEKNFSKKKEENSL